MSHHTVKDTFASNSGTRIDKDDPFYGSQWLKAHCTGGYYMRRSPTDPGPILVNKKDSHSCLLSKISLIYQPETYTVFMSDLGKSIPIKDRLLMVYRTFRSTNKSVSFRELQGCLLGVSDSHLRNLLDTPPWDTAFIRVKSIGTSTLYVPDKDV